MSKDKTNNLNNQSRGRSPAISTPTAAPHTGKTQTPPAPPPLKSQSGEFEQSTSISTIAVSTDTTAVNTAAAAASDASGASAVSAAANNVEISLPQWTP